MVVNREARAYYVLEALEASYEMAMLAKAAGRSESAKSGGYLFSKFPEIFSLIPLFYPRKLSHLGLSLTLFSLL